MAAPLPPPAIPPIAAPVPALPATMAAEWLNGRPFFTTRVSATVVEGCTRAAVRCTAGAAGAAYVVLGVVKAVGSGSVVGAGLRTQPATASAASIVNPPIINACFIIVASLITLQRVQAD